MQKENKNVVVITVPFAGKAVVGQALPDNAPAKGHTPFVILNSFQDLHRLFSKRAFTLIELLVVVLIIGILAAVAVPQYRFAMDKARLMPYVQKVQDILKAEKVYYLANGEYTPDLTTLDIDMTKLCNSLLGNSNVYDCPGGIGINVSQPNQWVALYYCGEQSSRCNTNDDEKRYLMLTWKLTGEFNTCENYGTTRGTKLCNYFTQQFGVN